MDKVGHATTAYYVGKLGINVMDWTGMQHRNAILFGGSLGSIFLTSIEIFDGYSSQWGFSKGDIVANTAGSILVIGEELIWDEQRVSIKFSYTPIIGGSCMTHLIHLLPLLIIVKKMKF